MSLCARGGGSSSGRGSGSRRDDTRTWRVKEEPEDVKPVVAPPGFEVPPELQDDVHDGDIPGPSFALVESASEIERDSPGFLETVLRSAQMAASASTSRAHHDGASISRADSSSTLILLDDSDDSSDSFDWSAESK